MSLKRIGKKIVDFLRSETMNKAVIVVIVLAILIFVSGSVYSLTARNVLGLIFLRGGGIRVFIWTINAQTHAETMIIFLYYLMGFGGLWLYVNATTRSGDPRTTKYMLFFSFLLILFAGLGLYSAFVAKFTGP
ncbi:MAG TPA: hypothetical protein ENF33_05505 [Nitrososphaeria archaeon]|nr:hypothetical protein [Nitrososphaeria archaeon]